MKKIEKDTTFWVTAGVLFLFWILITGRFHWQHLLVGAACSYAITLFNYDLLLKPAERSLYHKKTFWKWFVYFCVLVVAIFKSNWDVAKIVLNPKMDISPGFIKYRARVRKPLNRVILANSITLTPGTLTVELEGDIYVVHALTRGNAEDVSEWGMIDRLVEIEEVEQNGV
ncbi:MAG: Na+/H+ antiporter subunit E [Dethiobacter sp.]